MSARPPAVRVNRKAAARIVSGHVWIYASDVISAGGAAAGDVVTVEGPGGRPLGTAHYSSASQIALRLLSPRVEPVDRSFYARRIEAAIGYRRRVAAGTDAFRLIYGEADGLPGLIVDRYAGWLSLQALDQGMDRATGEIVSCLEELLAPAGIVARNDAAVREKENLKRETAVIAGEVPAAVEVRMNGLRFQADLVHGQKTGLYLDQRENYRAAARYARGRALDCFTSSGGFALHISPGCESVEAVDSSAGALRLAEANRQSNGAGNVSFRQADVFGLLAGYAQAGRRFTAVVLDPPAFAKSRGGLEGAARGYREINRRALELLEPGGVLVTCSCSHHMSEAMFLEIVAQASLAAQRPLRIIERRTQARDHPILLTVAETHYLKCLIAEAF